MDKEAISVKELATTLGISLPKAYELVRLKGFPHFKVGSRILIPLIEFRNWMTTNSKN